MRGAFDLDLADPRGRSAGIALIHHPRGLETQEASLLNLHTGVGDIVEVAPQLRQWFAERLRGRESGGSSAPAPFQPYLSRACSGECGPIRRLEKFGTGQSNPTYKMSTSTGTFVLRSKPPGVLLKSAHLVEREFEVMHALKNTLPELEIADRGAIYDAMADNLAELHSIDLAEVGLSDFGKPGNYFERQLDRWSRQYLASVEVPDRAMTGIMEWLGIHLPPDDGQTALVHGDYRLDNMMFAPEASQVVALLDWELATLGHPLADLAYQCMQWRLPYQGNMRGLGGLDRAELGLPSEHEYVARYCEKRGISPPDNWAFYLVFSTFRLAAILQGVVARAQGGNASNPDTANKYAAAIPVLIKQAVDIAHDPSEKAL
ncbi:Acyl-CoA dehydrogenase family member 10 [Nymphon striatum]|nr:Acyl-CoA dehydrogenase family member 10 [Nymphon striatum]